MKKMLNKFYLKVKTIRLFLSISLIKTVQEPTQSSPFTFKSEARSKVVRKLSCLRLIWLIWQVHKELKKLDLRGKL